MSRRTWTKAEVKYMERFYAWKNIDQIVNGLERLTGVKRTRNSVLSKAVRLMLADHVPENYSRLAWAHWRNGKRVKTTYLYQAARRDGVLKRQLGGHNNPYLVPTAWLEEKIRELNAGAHGYTPDEIREQWLTSAQAGEIFGIPSHKFGTSVANEKTTLRRIFDEHVRRWRDIQHSGYRYYWHPSDVRVAHSLFVEYKRTKAAKNPIDNLIRNHPRETSNGTTFDAVRDHQAEAL